MAAVTADDETREEESSHVLQASTGSAAISLEGTLYCRKGRASGSYSSLRWKRRFVFLDLVDGGSITIYRDPPNSDPYTSGNKQTAPRTASRLESLVSQTKSIDDDSLSNIEMFIPAELSWVAKDVENNTSSFVVEIPTISDDVDFIVSDESMCSSMLADSPRDYDANEDAREHCSWDVRGRTGGFDKQIRGCLFWGGRQHISMHIWRRPGPPCLRRPSSLPTCRASPTPCVTSM